MATILLALGLVLIVEGLVYVLAPSLVEDMLAALRNMPIEARRVAGALALVTGLILLWFASLLGA
ncbi:MAG: hypothetical protein ACI86S_000672 [Paracoccaceae bacterium]|jgi:uncharacterized protein YjeT (DUF2065 family)